MIPDYGPRHPPGYTTGVDSQLLRTVLQDSINLLEQVGCLIYMDASRSVFEVENEFRSDHQFASP